MNAKETLYKKCAEKNGCFLPGQVGWIVEAMEQFAAQKEPTEVYQIPEKSKLSDKELIEVLKEECRRVKVQRNDYEQQLIQAIRKVSYLKFQNENFESYINRKK